MSDGSTWKGDPRSWVMMNSKAFGQNYSTQPWWTGQARWKTNDQYGDKVTRAPYYNGQMWFSDREDYGKTFANYYDSKGNGMRKGEEQYITGVNFLSAIPKIGKYRRLQPPPKGTYDWWLDMPYKLVGRNIIRNNTANLTEPIKVNQRDRIVFGKRNYGPGTHILKFGKIQKSIDPNGVPITFKQSQHKTDNVVEWSRQLGDNGIFIYNIDDGPIIYRDPQHPWKPNTKYPIEHPIINEFISQPGFTDKIKFIEGNNGDFDINNPYKYAFEPASNKEDILRAFYGTKLTK